MLIILFKNYFSIRLKGLIFLNLIFLNLIFFKKSTFFKKNLLENEYWYFVELLNNNNKSILLFILLYIYVFLINIVNNNFLLRNFIIYLTTLYIVILCIYTNKLLFIEFFKTELNNNIILINGVILIHPILIYYTYIIFLFLYIVNDKLLELNNIVMYIYLNKLKLFVISFSGLLLGAYWAQQEINWGGWWNWDYVEIIALVFNILSLYVMHNTFTKYFNKIYLILKNILYYLICFFLFVRIDILNSIHSFNSINISNNYKNLIILFLLIFGYKIYHNFLNFYLKFYKNAKINFILFFFKIVNILFIFYFFINVLAIFYFNFQFIDLTKFIKLILILIFNIFILNVIYNNTIIVVFNLLIFTGFYTLNLNWYITTIIIILFVKHNKYKNTIINYIFYVSHYIFICFLLLIRYDYSSQYENFFFTFDFFNLLINNDYIFSLNTLKSIFNANSHTNLFLFNFDYKVNINTFYFTKTIYINNIIYNNFCYIIYNIDTLVNYLMYNIYITILNILLFIVLSYLTYFFK